jgi:hypothetical protein
MFYSDTVYAARYVNNILSPFFTELTEEDRLYGVFQQDSATAHMAYLSLEALQEIIGDCIISCSLWPPHSPHFGTTKKQHLPQDISSFQGTTPKS